MANSGSYQVNARGYSTTVSWGLAYQDINRNVSGINWNWFANWASSTFVMNASGYVGFQGSARFQNGYNTGRRLYGGQFANGSFEVGHDNGGNCVLESDAGIALYSYNQVNTGGNYWDLPSIPRQAWLTNLSQDVNDEDDWWIEFSNPAGLQTNGWFELPNLGGGRFYQRDYIGSRQTWQNGNPNRDDIRSLMKNTKTTTIRYVLETYAGGWKADWRDSNLTIVNANPIFSQAPTYKDTNATTVAITGNDQYLISGYSTLRATLNASGKASALKMATMSSYLFYFNGANVSQPFSDTNDVIADFNTTTSSQTNLTLSAQAVDSRGYTTQTSTNVNVVPYSSPSIIASATRANNFEATTTIKISGAMSLISVNGITKNVVDTASGIQYRCGEKDGTMGAWINAPSTTSATGVVSVSDFMITLDNSKQYQVDFKITDKLSSATTSVSVDAGIPIFRISTADNLIYNQENVLMKTHIGQIIMSTTLSTPGSVKNLYGGTWVAWGTGRFPVGMGSNGADNFQTVEATGGESRHLLSWNEMPQHNHAQDAHSHNTHARTFYSPNVSGATRGDGLSAGQANSSSEFQFGISNDGQVANLHDSGANWDHENKPPFIVCYMWKRTV